MNKTIRMVVIAIVGLCILSLMTPLSAAQQQADVPEWEQGQTWSMGYEAKANDIFGPVLGMLEGQATMDPDIDKIETSLSGEFGFYQIYKITEVTDDEYTMSIKAGGGVHISASAKVTGQMDRPGTYEWSDDIPTDQRTVSGELDFHYTMDIEGEVNFERDTLAIKDIELDITMSLRVTFVGKNIPEYDWDWEADTKTISYEDYNIRIEGDVDISLSMNFEPALDIFHFPIEVDEQWAVESTMTLSGTYSGQIDASGLPEEVTEEMKAEGYSFPLTLEDIDIPDTDIDGGVIPETEIPIYFMMECIGTEEIELEDGTTDTVMLLSMAPDFYGYTRSGSEYGAGYTEGYAEGYSDGEYDNDEGLGYYTSYDNPDDYSTDYMEGYTDGYYMGYINGYYEMPYDDSYYYYDDDDWDWDDDDWDDDWDTGFGFPDLSMVMKYSPERGFIVSQGMAMEGMEFFDMPEMEMKPMSEGEASRGMESMQEMPDEESILDKLMSPPLLYVLIGVIAVIVILAVVVSKKGGKKSPVQSPPQQQWQQQPPQQQPPQQQPPQQQPPQQQPPQQQPPQQPDVDQSWDSDEGMLEQE